MDSQVLAERCFNHEQLQYEVGCSENQARHSSALHILLTECSRIAGASAFYFCSANFQ